MLRPPIWPRRDVDPQDLIREIEEDPLAQFVWSLPSFWNKYTAKILLHAYHVAQKVGRIRGFTSHILLKHEEAQDDRI